LKALLNSVTRENCREDERFLVAMYRMMSPNAQRAILNMVKLQAMPAINGSDNVVRMFPDRGD
jgi:hypothetical protein